MDVARLESIARLARIDIDADLAARFTSQLDAVLGHFDSLAELDLDGVEPAVYAIDLAGRTREDDPSPSPLADAILANAPSVVDRCFLVPRVLD